MVRTIYSLSRFTANVLPGQTRLAVFSWLYARHSGGEFHLRVEDTDTEGKKAPDDGAEDDLKWLGLDWDNTILKQSERMERYESLAARLVKEGRAYPCYCTLQEIEERNKAVDGKTRQHHYDGKCRNLSGTDIQKYEAEGRRPSIRLVAYNETFSCNDHRKGNVVIPDGTVGDFIILRSNKTPIGVFAETADSIDAGVTHLFRNEENLSATARQLMLFRAFAAEPPVFYYLPALTGPDGRKVQHEPGRNGLDLSETRNSGYLPDTTLNHFTLLGWNSPDGRELFGRDELIKAFTPDGICREPAVYDPTKLDWISRHTIINESIENIFEQSVPYFKKNAPATVKEMLDDPEKMVQVKKAVDLVRGYCTTLSGIQEHASSFLSDEYSFSEEAVNILGKKEAGKILPVFRTWIEENERRMDENLFGEMIADISKSTDFHGKNLFQTLKAALTGRTDGPDIYYLIPVIGRERALQRIDRAAGIDRSGRKS